MTITSNCRHELAANIRDGLKRMNHCNLDYDFVDQGPKTPTTTTVAAGGAPCGRNQLVDGIDLLCYAMEKMGRKYSDLHVLSKHPSSRSAYTIKEPLRDFLGELCVVPEYKSVLTSQINKIIAFLTSNPKYGGISSIKVDLNLIEVCSFSTLLPNTITSMLESK